jgi:hypothetical protein
MSVISRRPGPRNNLVCEPRHRQAEISPTVFDTGDFSASTNLVHYLLRRCCENPDHEVPRGMTCRPELCGPLLPDLTDVALATRPSPQSNFTRSEE